MVRLADVDEIAREHRFARTAAASVLSGLSGALALLVARDAKLLAWGAAERAVCHRLAVYLEEAVINDEPGDEQAHSVYPELIVHQRDTTTNLLVIEMKVLRPSTKRSEIEFDFRKLTVFQEPCGGFEYEAAALVLVLPEDVEGDGDSSRVAVYTAVPGTWKLDIAAATKEKTS